MSFRVITFKEYYTRKGGMRLTYPTLGAMLKYPWTSDFATSENKFECFQSEFDTLHTVGTRLGLLQVTFNEKEKSLKYARHPLAFLVEAADDICYRILDLEDAVELGILPSDFIMTVEKLFLSILDEFIDVPYCAHASGWFSLFFLKYGHFEVSCLPSHLSHFFSIGC